MPKPDPEAALREWAMKLGYLSDPRSRNISLACRAGAEEIADLKTWVIAFGAMWVQKHAKEWGLPDGTLFGAHYDILERCGARMDDFTRYERPMVEGGVGCVGHAPAGERG